MMDPWIIINADEEIFQIIIMLFDIVVEMLFGFAGQV